MSHIPQRKDKDCLNCGTVVQGRYCHVCGQENVVPKETFWHMVTHFFNDITHFDGSFFTTAKDLLFKPGFLSKEYMAGRRVKYLHPVRMYVFTSAIFFLLFFSFFSIDDSITFSDSEIISGKDRLAKIEKLEKKYKDDITKSERLIKLQPLKDTTKPLGLDDFALLKDEFAVINISGEAEKYTTVEEYDSIQSSLSSKERDSWLKQRLVHKELSIKKKYGGDPVLAAKKLGDTVLHRLPYLLFVSLPLFTLILRIIYIRRKQFYFADHGIFTIHLYVFTFILLLLVFLLNKLEEISHLDFIGYFIGALIILLFIYLYKAMRFFYEQNRIKTILKFIIVLLSSFVLIMFLLTFFLIFSAFNL